MTDNMDHLLRSFSKNLSNTSVVRTRYLLVMDGVNILAALGLSLLLRYESISITNAIVVSIWYLIPFSILVRLIINGKLGLYSHLWRYASMREVL